MLLVILYGGIFLSALLLFYTIRDLRRPRYFLFRHKILGYCLVAGLTILILSGISARLVFPNILVTKSVRLDLPHLNSEIKIAFVSDLQVGMGKETGWIKRVVEKIVAANPDAVVLGGDLIDNEGGQNEEPYLEPLLDLAKQYPMYYIMGNHEYGIGGTTRQDIDYQTGDRSEDLRQYFAGQIMELHNSGSIVTNQNGDKVSIFGFDDIWHQVANYTLYQTAISNTPTLDTVVFAHNPDIAYNWPLEAPKPPIVISGHTHGGQVRLPFVAPLADAKIQLGDKYYSGLNYYHDIPIYTSVGAGESAAPIRFLTLPEVIVFTVY